MKCDLSPCKKVLYLDELKQIVHHLLSIGIFVSIAGILTTTYNEYYVLLGLFMTGFVLNKLWGNFFIKPNSISKRIKSISLNRKSHTTSSNLR